MSIYHFDDYKKYFNDWIRKQPKEGHGEYRRLAQALGVSTTMISQVFNGEKHLSLELTSELIDYLRLSENEGEYFLLLVERQRAGSIKLEKKLSALIEKRQLAAQKIENRLRKDMEISEETKSVFYSDWIYSAVRILSAVEQFQDRASLAERLQMPRNHVSKIIDFLLLHGLCEEQNGRITTGNTTTHIGSSHVLANRHHQNWRMQSLRKMSEGNDSNLFFTFPCALSEKDAAEIRQNILDWIIDLRKKVGPSSSETVRCLNLDWFEY